MDKKIWMEAIAAQLPQGKGRLVSTVTGGARQYDIYIRWSNCIGTLLKDADLAACDSGSDSAFREFRMELRL
jgi:type IV pilus assembly protein PilV